MNNLGNFAKYINKRGHRLRIVNQREIFEWLKEAGPLTESQIFYEIYDFSRGGHSNKKYADCLRRLLSTGKISRSKNDKNIFEYYTVCMNFNDEPISKEDEKFKIRNFDIVQIRNGNIYLACIDRGILINLEEDGFNYISNLGDDLIHINNNKYDVIEIYRGREDYSLSYMNDFKNNKMYFTKIWERPKAKVHIYTTEQIKEKLGISPLDMLVVSK